MKTLNTKLVLSALGIVAMLTSPALAKKPQHVTSHVSQSAVSDPIPGYARDGSVVEIQDPDQNGAQSQR
jgi:hypothetical protein